MKRAILPLFAVMILLLFGMALAEDNSAVENKDSIEVKSEITSDITKPDQVIVYYLHMNRRCMTCQKLETYSKEAVEAGFADRLKDSTVVWRVENFESEGNEHFVKDYQIYNQSLILSRIHDGKEIEWKNLDKIWKLVGDKEDYIAYVQSELKDFLNTETKE